MTVGEQALAGTGAAEGVLAEGVLAEGGVVEATGVASPGQQRLWFLDRLEGPDPAYNVFAFDRMTGPVDPRVLDRALAEIVRRHEPLRSRFTEVDGEPVMQVLGDVSVPFEVLDLRAEADPAAAAAAAAARWSRAPFDLGQAPLLRAGLARTGDDEHLLCVCLHHIVSDGWSMGVLRSELATLYGAFAAGRPSPLPPLPATYREHLAAAAAPERLRRSAASLEYWTRQLADVPVLALPIDRRRPDDPAPDRGETCRTFVPADLVAGVRRLARASRCTAFMVWLAAYQVLLSRYSGQDDLCVATPVAGRDRPEHEPLIGYFSNTVVLRADLSGEPGFAEALRRTRTAALAAYTHGDLPFEQVMSALRIARGGSRNPLFGSWFNMHTETLVTGSPVWAPGLTVDWLAEPPEPAATAAGPRSAPLDRGYDLAVDFWPGDDALYLTFTYDRELFDARTVQDLADRFLLLVAAVVADPERPVGNLPLLHPGEVGSLAHGPAVADDAGAADAGTVVGLVLAAAGRTPAAVAVRCGEESWDYARLAARSADVAVSLRDLGAGPGSIVGVCVRRSPELVAALLGVMRAGAAYLPLDPAYPQSRLQFMLSDSGCALVLADGSEDGRFDDLDLDVVRTDRIDASGRPDDGPADGGHATPDGLAYVIYTSGSTGVPKGVGIEHGGLSDRVRWMRDSYPITASDRVLQFASFGFDTHAEEMYPVLAAGGTLVVPTVAPELLPEWLPTPQGRSLTVLDLPTSYWHRLVHDLDPSLWPPDLRLVIIGGAQADAATVGTWRALLGDRVELLNTYGPTEATIVATSARLTADDALRNPSIGTPAAGTAAYLLDPGGGVVPPGVPGELHLAGTGVARGYLGRAELTAERFPDDPYGAPGTRMFRTGDLARLRRDGGLEFLGRLDRQVKVRGYRVELGEIEAALLEHPEVAEAVAVVHPDGADATLVAYLVAAPGTSPSPAQLRRHLSRSLPPHLVPSAFVTLDRLPLTVHGKPDLRSLPAPTRAAVPAERPHVEPRTDAEQLVAEIWAEVLGRERVGALDDFFELGGHSLLATRVTARLRAALDVELPLRVLFTTPTLAGVAEAVEELLMAEIDALSDDEVARRLVDGQELQ